MAVTLTCAVPLSILCALFLFACLFVCCLCVIAVAYLCE